MAIETEGKTPWRPIAEAPEDQRLILVESKRDTLYLVYRIIRPGRSSFWTDGQGDIFYESDLQRYMEIPE